MLCRGIGARTAFEGTLNVWILGRRRARRTYRATVKSIAIWKTKSTTAAPNAALPVPSVPLAPLAPTGM